MLRRLGLIAEQEGLDIGFWEDGLNDKRTEVPYPRDTFPSSINVYAFVWQTVWEWWGGDRAFNLANRDYKVGFSNTINATHLHIIILHESTPSKLCRHL